MSLTLWGVGQKNRWTPNLPRLNRCSNVAVCSVHLPRRPERIRPVAACRGRRGAAFDAKHISQEKESLPGTALESTMTCSVPTHMTLHSAGLSRRVHGQFWEFFRLKEMHAV